MSRILVLALVAFMSVTLGRAALDTALALPGMISEAKERSSW